MDSTCDLSSFSEDVGYKILKIVAIPKATSKI